MTSQIDPMSSSVSVLALGRLMHRSNSLSELPFEIIGAFAKTGCRCIGLKPGLASILAWFKAARIAVGELPKLSASTQIVVNQWFGSHPDGTVWNVIPPSGVSSRS